MTVGLLPELEVDTLPRRAGNAELDFDDYNRVWRDGPVIHLPTQSITQGGVDFQPLVGGRQFLWVCGYDHSIVTTQAFFGGQDEEPFLVEVTPEAIGQFYSNGEDAFYNYLIPRRIQSLSQECNIKPKRQGDIWALPLPEFVDCKTFELTAKIFFQPVYLRSVSDETLFGTRHRLTGRCFSLSPNRQLDFPISSWMFGVRDSGLRDQVMIAEGAVTAPDHKELNLVGMNILAQTTGLKRPQTAD